MFYNRGVNKHQIYGVETIIDLHGCDATTFNRRNIKVYFVEMCAILGVSPEDCYFWDDYRISKEKRQTNPKTKGTTAIQFILTSNITIHTLDLLKTVFINIFSCKEYDKKAVESFTLDFWQPKRHKITIVERGIT